MTKAIRNLLFMIALTVFILPATPAFGLGNMQIPPGPQQQQKEDPFSAEQKREIAKQQNVQRQEELRKDTDKLLELATELKQYVDKNNENVLSMNVMKKAEQIEKLAKSVREKMKGQ